MSGRPMISGSVQQVQEQPGIPDFKSTVIDLDPDGWATLSPEDQMEVGETFFQNNFENNPDFQAMPEPDRVEVRQTFFSNHFAPPDLRPQGMEAFKAQTEARINQLRNTNPLAAGAYDLMTPFQGMAEGALQGLSAGGYDPQEQANENIIRQAQRGVGQFAGTMAGFLGTAPILSPAGSGALYGGVGSMNQQADEGKNIQNMNWNRVGGHTLLGAGTGILPATFGGRLPTRVASGAALGGVLNSGGLAIDQLGETGKIDLSDPAYAQAFIQGAGLGAGSAFMGGPSQIRQRPAKPISMAQIHKTAPPQVMQAHVTHQAPARTIPAQPRQVMEQKLQQARQSVADFQKGQALKVQEKRQALRQAAVDLHEMLHSDDPNIRIQGQALKKQFEQEAADKYSRRTPGTVRKAGNPYAKRVLAELEIYKEQSKQRASFQSKEKQTQDAIVGVGMRMRKTEEGKAKFETEISKRFSSDEKKIIMGRIKDAEAQQKEAANKDKTKKLTRREKGIEKRNEINRQRQEQRQKTIKAENDRIKKQLEAQKAEEKAAKERTIQQKREAAKRESQLKQEQAARQKQLRELEAQQKRLTTEASKAQEKAKKEAIAAQKKALADREKAIREEGRKAAAEQNKESKAKLLPKVLEPEQIEAQADALLAHHKAGEKGTLDAKLTKLRGIVRANHGKDGLIAADRTEAIQDTHAKVLDRFYQKKAAYESEQKPDPKEKLQARIKAKAENMKDLEAIKAAGGDYNLQTGKGKQSPVKSDRMKWEEAREFIPKDDPAYRYGEIWGEAARNDGDVTIRYDSERSGDTGSFEYKRVSPIDLSFNFSRDKQGNIIDTKLIGHAVNENGHTGEYYLQPSDANPKTGTISAVLEEPILHKDSFGKAKRNGDPNVYFGPRSFKVMDILTRPARKTVGLTSELQAKYVKAKQLLDAVDNNRKGKGIETVPASAIKKVARQSKALQDAIAKDELDPAELKNLSTELGKLDPDSKRAIDEGTGC